MIAINLLPAEKKRLGVGSKPVVPITVSLIFLAVSVMALALYFSYFEKNIQKSIQDKDKEIAQVKKESAEYDKLLANLNSKKSLLTEVKSIEQKSNILYQTLQVLKESTPPDVQYNSLTLNEEEENNIVIAGSASSPRAAARFRTFFDSVSWVKSALLSSITIGDDGIVQFSLTLTSGDLEKK